VKDFIIPFNRPYYTGNEISYIEDAMCRHSISGNGYFTKKASDLLREMTNTKLALLTQSCTSALEMAALLLDLKLGDEVILPSYTFVSTANAFVLRGCKLVFVDVLSDNLNIDPREIERAITARTKAIVVVHYGGVACDMTRIMELAKASGVHVVEDAAQAICATHELGPLGSIGTLGCLSFHETKNVISGEGGALLVNDDRLVDRAEIIWEKGTNRKKFFMGQVDKYTWVDIGSSFLPSELTAAFLTAQLEQAQDITSKRRKIWEKYLAFFNNLDYRLVKDLGLEWYKGTDHNGHLFYLLFRDQHLRDAFIYAMRQLGVMTVFHYLPLHSSEYGKALNNESPFLPITERIASCLVRLPIWPDLGESINMVMNALERSFDIIQSLNPPRCR